jgi:hypothetical protein
MTRNEAIALADKIKTRRGFVSDILDVRIEYDGNFTVALVRAENYYDGVFWSIGVSKFNPNDTIYNADIGASIAISKAMGYIS